MKINTINGTETIGDIQVNITVSLNTMTITYWKDSDNLNITKTKDKGYSIQYNNSDGSFEFINLVKSYIDLNFDEYQLKLM